MQFNFHPANLFLNLNVNNISISLSQFYLKSLLIEIL